MPRILWRSWTPEWTAFEVARLQSIGLNWHDGHKLYPLPDDIWLTVNGQDSPHQELVKPAIRATFYAETYQYMQHEYDQFPNDNKWDYRFTYNTDLLRYPNTHYIPLPGYWEMDGKKEYLGARDLIYAMVLTKKFKKLSACDLGLIRTEFVESLRDKNFAYWGLYWDMKNYGVPLDEQDPNYQGTYFKAFDKHFESRELLARAYFGLALDTSHVNGFVTEKFWNVLAAGALPIYIGPLSIRKHVPDEVYINAFEFESVKDVIDYCEKMTIGEWSYRTRKGREFWLADKEHSWEAAFTKIDSVLCAPQDN